MARAARPTAVTAVPHSKQNFASDSSAVPQLAHRTASGVAHSRQNFACGGFSCRHRGQFTRPPRRVRKYADRSQRSTVGAGADFLSPLVTGGGPRTQVLLATYCTAHKLRRANAKSCHAVYSCFSLLGTSPAGIDRREPFLTRIQGCPHIIEDPKTVFG